MKRNYQVPLYSVMAAALLAACGGDTDNGSETEATAGEEEIVLRMSWWGSQERHNMTNEIIEMYESENPHVSIQPDFAGFDGYFEKMATQAAGGNLPDIMQQNHGEFVNQYASQGQLADLQPFIDDGTINVSAVSETVLESGEFDGELVGLPTGMNALAGLYDPDMIESAGAELPNEDWTWEDMIDMATTVHESTGNYGMRLMEPGNMFEYYLRDNGKRLFNEDGTDLGYEDDQLFVEYLTMNKRMVDDGVAPGYDVIGEIQGLEDELLVHGTAAINFRWTNQLNTIASAAGDDRNIELAILPGDNNDEAMYLRPSMLWSIAENSQHKEEAAKFIDFYTNQTEVFDVVGSDRGVPINEDIQEEMRSDLNETDQKVFDFISYVTDHSTPVDSNYPPQAAQVLNALEDVDELVIYGQMTPEEGAAQFRQEANAILGN
ncbi:predicted rhamnose oligosaccharide ABC transport system, substrate-binding component [Geomicrobium sp. JCM 19037]|uniref:ABC transporter substrate-binding protein n=1 Tax=unclassified Geomicrobium TaxID=2628951 RepID=UPI00045F3A8F|nr:sugar ABC transporter substrate-binding protein [Geomicrobium sp. JCM 19037]GAK05920.1 predicted rhamnose oligosaccharide ABC transport system, substrate-binding component [Geomicrobium sp. JCM 19037]